jgi:hypothetical protein
MNREGLEVPYPPTPERLLDTQEVAPAPLRASDLWLQQGTVSSTRMGCTSNGIGTDRLASL